MAERERFDFDPEAFAAASADAEAFLHFARSLLGTHAPCLLAPSSGGVWRIRRALDWPIEASGQAIGRPAGLSDIAWAPPAAFGLSAAPHPLLATLALGEDGRFGALLLALPGHDPEVERRARRARPLLQAAASALCAREELLRVEELDRLAGLGRHLAGVVHELATPLQTVVSLAEMIERGGSLAVARAGTIKAAALRCREIVGDVLRFAAPQPAARTGVDLNEVVLDALELDRLSGPGQVEVEVESSDFLRVRAEGRRLVQVVLNLLSNARRALRAAGSEDAVRVRLESIEGRTSRLPLPADHPVARLSIVDQGPGVPREIAARIFEPFFTTHNAEEGSGLGLGVSRAIVEGSGGLLYLDEEHGPGARFVVELPISHGEPEEAGDSAAASVTPGARRILVVDDDPQMISTYTSLLELEGHEVEGCRTSEDALASAARGSFDLIVCDLRLGDESGLDLREALRARAPELAECFILATGDVARERSRRTLSTFDGPLLIKPFRLEDLLEAIARVSPPSR